MFMIRFIFRLTFFLIGLTAIIVIFWAAFSFFSNNTSSNIVIAEAEFNNALQETSVGRSPEGIEDFVRYFILELRANEIGVPISDDPTEIPFRVALGETTTNVGQRLAQIGLISDANLFQLFMRYNGLDVTLEAGDYTLRRNMNMVEIGEALQRARVEEVRITIPEGLRAEQIAELLDQENIMNGPAFMDIVRLGSLIQHPLLADHPAGTSYEGYLYPDTYQLPDNAAPEDLITLMLDTLALRLNENLGSGPTRDPDGVGYAFALAAQQSLTFHQILIIASIVEREAVLADERPTIASVYLNRIKRGMYLNADPTVQYAIGYQPQTGQWWKTPVTLDEYSSVDSPYNTYLVPGLPPAPIASPGIASIIATLNPAPTNFLFFVVSDPNTGAHIFAETFEEHERNVAAYQGR